MKGIIKGNTKVGGTILINKKRMDKALASETFDVPAGMTKEETRQFIINMGKENGNDLPKR